jgi:hypothetical protein
MKKLWILLVALTILAAVPMFASDVTLSGELMGYAYTDFGAGSGAGFPKLELNLAAAVDDFNTLKLELDSEGGDFAGGLDLADLDNDGLDNSDPPEAIEAGTDIFKGNVAVDDVRLITDWGAALMLPIGIKTTVGYFDTYFTGWYYYDNTGWTWYYDWPNKVVQQGPDSSGAVQIDIAAGPVNVHWYNDGAGQDFMVGADAAFGGLSAWLAYGATFQDFAGTLSIEAAYAIMDMANVGAFFRLGLGDDPITYTYGVNVGAGFGMFHVAAGFEGDDVDVWDNAIAEITVAPTDAAKIAVTMFSDTAAGADWLQGIDISGRYSVGAAQFFLGYAIALGADTITAYPNGDQFAADGLYAGAYIAY